MIAECLLIKNENRYLHEHIINNVRAGIDFFYIYDNNSDEPVKQFLQKTYPSILSICKIETITATNNLQLECYALCIEDHGAQCNYIAFVDTDEIFIGNLKDTMYQYKKASAVIFAPVLHGCNGVISDNGGGMVETYKDDIISYRDSWTKCISKPNAIIKQDVHKVILKPGYTPQYISIKSHQTTVLHHYRFKSFEEYVKKILRGSCDPRACFAINSFFDFNKTIDPNSDEVKKILTKYNVNLDTYQNY